jgi:nucleoid-associated protein YgaU
MFTAMISRYRLVVALLGLAVACSVGWAAFELGRSRFADAPSSAIGAPPSEHAIGDRAGPEGPTAAAPATPDAVASGADRTVDAPTRPEQQQSAPAPAPQIEEPATAPPSRALAARNPEPAPVERRTAAIAGQVGAPASPGEVQSPTTVENPPSRVVPQPGPPVETGGAQSAAEERTAAAAPPAQSGPEEGAPAGARGVLADRASTLEEPSQPSLAPPGDAAAEPPGPKGPAPPDAGASVGLAVPAPAGDDAGPASARAAETIKRAIATLFGGAADEPVPPQSEEAETAAVRDAPTPERGGALADLEPGAAPTFDIVRVERGGRTVIAGRAVPGAEVEIKSGDRMIDRVHADRRGEWVAVPPEPLAAGVRELSLAARVENRPAVESEEVVVVAVPELPDPPPPELALPGVDQPAPAQVAAMAPADEAFAVALPREGAGRGRILQAPGRISSDGALALEMLDYDEAGRIRLSGEASAGAALRIYVDNEPAGATVVKPSGRWDAVLEHTLTPGDYMLRLDQLSASGRPDARLETPFTRASDPPVAGDVQVDYVIVQPGNSLWRIARRVLGEGMRYVHIYEANQAQIRDPDLIYPGQVFEVPSGLGTAG